jgi:hypothetical protein
MCHERESDFKGRLREADQQPSHAFPLPAVFPSQTEVFEVTAPEWVVDETAPRHNGRVFDSHPLIEWGVGKLTDDPQFWVVL